MTLRGLGLRRWYSDSVAPTSAEDAAAGFRLGDHWVDTVTDTAYVLVDASAGTWAALGGGGGGGVASVFGRTGAVVAVGTDYAGIYQGASAELTAYAGLGVAGLVVRTGAGAATARTLTGTAAQVSVADGDGVAGAPTIGLASDATLPGTGGVVLPAGTTAQRGTATTGRVRWSATLAALEVYDGAAWVQVSTVPTAAQGTYFFEDFLVDVAITTAGGRGIETNLGTGAQTTSTANVAGSGNRPGQVTSTTGTTATGGATWQAAGSTAIELGGGVWRADLWVRIPTLSTVTEEYALLLGFFDVVNAANQVDGLYILYDRLGTSSGSAASPNWQTVSSRGSTRTFRTSAVVVVANTWVRATVIADPVGGQVGYYLDGVLLTAVHTTNIPAGASQITGFGWCVKKSAGTTARTVIVDAVALACTFTTPR